LRKALSANNILEVKNLIKHFPVSTGILVKRNSGVVRAVDDVSFTVPQGKTVGLVGESGSGKTTVAKLIFRLYEPTSGSIVFDGNEISSLKDRDGRLTTFRKKSSMVFQDPYSSLDPRKRVWEIISEPLAVHHWGNRGKRRDRANELLQRVGLRAEDADRFPHQFSGGQRQRIAIARALALSPVFVVADEAVSALDVSIQAKIINLLMEIQRQMNLSYLFISHDLAIVRHISDIIVVMYLGKVVEYGSTFQIFDSPCHPYTKALLAIVPDPNIKVMRSKKIQILKGEIPSPMNPPSGCHFRTRCPYAREKCAEVEPELERTDSGQLVACHFWREIS
jgi:oligopeptide transport system ATP-binding protein